MKLAILQPSFLPWLGFFDQWAQADQFILLDDVQYTRRDWRNRNRIRTAEGWAWLTVPVIQKHRFHQSLKDARIDHAVRWRRKHLESLRHNYHRAPGFDALYPPLETLYNREWTFLLDLCLQALTLLKDQLGIETPVRQSSELNVDGKKSGRILEICRTLGATTLLTGNKAGSYLDIDMFGQTGIRVEFHNYAHPSYPQQWPGFVPYLSIVDLLFNCGKDGRKVLQG